MLGRVPARCQRRFAVTSNGPKAAIAPTAAPVVMTCRRDQRDVMKPNRRSPPISHLCTPRRPRGGLRSNTVSYTEGPHGAALRQRNCQCAACFARQWLACPQHVLRDAATKTAAPQDERGFLVSSREYPLALRPRPGRPGYVGPMNRGQSSFPQSSSGNPGGAAGGVLSSPPPHPMDSRLKIAGMTRGPSDPQGSSLVGARIF